MELGIDRFLAGEHKKFAKLRLGVLCNQASVDSRLRHVRDLVLDPKLKLKIGCFFGPQHGIRGEKQDNMIESDDFTDPKSELPVYSLYGSTREPTPKMIEGIDAFLVDLQDIGTRIYTFMYTLANCMRVARAHGRKVIVLDRPNPIGGTLTEGNALEPAFASFVGQFPMCVRHGLTMGELATLFNEEYGIGCELEIVPLKGWRRDTFRDESVADWIPPSPNIPRFLSALTFPGSVLFEGTNVSEGRGTTRPFEWIGAPFIDPDRLAVRMNALRLPGTYFRPIFFQPGFQKCKDQVCGGVQVHVTDPFRFNSFRAGVGLLFAIHELFPGKLEWKRPPYEYEYERMPIDLIAGTALLRECVESGKPESFEQAAQKSLDTFRRTRRDYLLYPERRRR